MTTRPASSNPGSIRFRIRGRPGAWTSSAHGGGGAATTSAGAPTASPGKKIDGRYPDGLPNPQAFSLIIIQAYPRETAICRKCSDLVLTKCARGWCHNLPTGHSFLLNAVADGECPIGKFNQEL